MALSTHCKYGHELSVVGTRKSRTGGRKCNACHSEYMRKRRLDNHFRSKQNESNKKVCQKLKIEILTIYGKNQELCCNWTGCSVDDVDMLTLDHVDNLGYQHKVPTAKKRLTGPSLYRYVRDNGFPEGYQTLCWNHQWKKRLTNTI